MLKTGSTINEVRAIRKQTPIKDATADQYLVMSGLIPIDQINKENVSEEIIVTDND